MRARIERLWPLLALALVAAIVLFSFPYLASAYYLEAGGRKLDDLERAAQLLKNAIEWDANNAQAYRLLGRVYRAQNNWQSALEMTRMYAALRGDNPLAHAELASTYEAMEAAGAPVQLEDLQARIAEEWRLAGVTTENLIRAGESARQARQYDVAIELYRRVMQMEPDAGDPWYHLGVLYESQERWQPALDAYAHAASVPYLQNVNRSNPPYRAGLIYHQRLDPPELDQALSSFEEALSLDDFDSDLDVAQCHYLVGYVLRQQKAQPDLYIAAFQRALALNPDHAWAHILLGMGIYARDQDLSGAESEVLKVLQIDPEHKWAYYYLGDLYSGEKLWDKALLMYQQALQIDPGFEAAANRLQVVQDELD